jgi:hypothetical protein
MANEKDEVRRLVTAYGLTEDTAKAVYKHCDQLHDERAVRLCAVLVDRAEPARDQAKVGEQARIRAEAAQEKAELTAKIAGLQDATEKRCAEVAAVAERRRAELADDLAKELYAVIVPLARSIHTEPSNAATIAFAKAYLPFERRAPGLLGANLNCWAAFVAFAKVAIEVVGDHAVNTLYEPGIGFPSGIRDALENAEANPAAARHALEMLDSYVFGLAARATAPVSEYAAGRFGALCVATDRDQSLAAARFESEWRQREHVRANEAFELRSAGGREPPENFIPSRYL